VQLISNIAACNEFVLAPHFTISAQLKRFDTLVKFATPEELVSLTDHENAIVRCYAFYGLRLIGSNSMQMIVNKHVDDKIGVLVRVGCIIEFFTVSEFFQNELKVYNTWKMKKLTTVKVH
jgi:hypothetical protein